MGLRSQRQPTEIDLQDLAVVDDGNYRLWRSLGSQHLAPEWGVVYYGDTLKALEDLLRALAVGSPFPGVFYVAGRSSSEEFFEVIRGRGVHAPVIEVVDEGVEHLGPASSLDGPRRVALDELVSGLARREEKIEALERSRAKKGGGRQALPDLGSKYQLVELIGRGGFGDVYQALNPSQDLVALKVLSDRAQGENVELFRREQRIHRVVDHPVIAGYRDAGEIRRAGKSYLFLELELIDGCPLSYLRRRYDESGNGGGIFEPGCVVRVIEAVNDALVYLNGLGLVHGDVKPNNILISNDGLARLIDLGLAEGPDDPLPIEDGSIIGTVEYIAPELYAGAARGMPVSDTFSLGMAAYFLVAGQLPFEVDIGRTQQYVARLVAEGVPRLNVHDEFDGLVAWMTQVDVEKRPSPQQLALPISVLRSRMRQESLSDTPPHPIYTRDLFSGEPSDLQRWHLE